MSDIPVKKSFCTTREAAHALGVSVGTVQLWVESGLLQAWKTAGGHRRVLRDSVDRLLHKESGSSAPAPLSADVMGRLSVMVVEDDVNLLRLYQANMSRWPMQPELHLLDNAVAALLRMGRQRPDLLVADLNMPDMDGFNMLRVLRSTPEFDSTTIVVVSGLDAAEITQRGGIPEGIEVLSKPIVFDRLLTIATNVVKQKTLQLVMP
jgi:excisionase family DNA binding protein